MGRTILHYDGNTWSAQASGATGGAFGLFGVWGSSATDVFAVGGLFEETILHYDGSDCAALNQLVAASCATSPNASRDHPVQQSPESRHQLLGSVTKMPRSILNFYTQIGT